MHTSSRVYDSHAQAVHVIMDLEARGISSSNISLITDQHGIDRPADQENVSEAVPGASLGAAIGAGAGLLSGLGFISLPGLGPVVAAGWLATTAVGAAAGAVSGGIFGALLGSGEPADTAHVYSEAVRRGGALVTVRSGDIEAAAVQDILNRHSPLDPRARRAMCHLQGGKSFDSIAAPVKPSGSDAGRTCNGF